MGKLPDTGRLHRLACAWDPQSALSSKEPSAHYARVNCIRRPCIRTVRILAGTRLWHQRGANIFNNRTDCVPCTRRWIRPPDPAEITRSNRERSSCHRHMHSAWRRDRRVWSGFQSIKLDRRNGTSKRAIAILLMAEVYDSDSPPRLGIRLITYVPSQFGHGVLCRIFKQSSLHSLLHSLLRFHYHLTRLNQI